MFSLAFRATIAIPLLFAWCGAASATNYSFTPGDAFFSANLTEDWVDALSPGDEPIEFSYRYPDGGGYFCGFAGFERLRVEGNTASIKTYLRKVYDELRVDYPKHVTIWREADGKEESHEENGFRMFLYNRDVDWKEQRIAVRYDENWHTPSELGLRSAERGEYNGQYARHYVAFVESVDAVAEDWQFGAKFPGLKVGIPDNVGWGIPGDRLQTPARAKAADVQLVIVPREDSLPLLFDREDGYSFLSVTSEGVQVVRWKNGDPVAEKWLTSAERRAIDADADEVEDEEATED
jgi:hypothetical protein